MRNDAHIWATTWWNSAPVYKTDKELATLVEHVDFSQTHDKRVHLALNLLRSGNRYSRTAIACQILEPLNTSLAYTGDLSRVTCVACWEEQQHPSPMVLMTDEPKKT